MTNEYPWRPPGVADHRKTSPASEARPWLEWMTHREGCQCQVSFFVTCNVDNTGWAFMRQGRPCAQHNYRDLDEGEDLILKDMSDPRWETYERTMGATLSVVLDERRPRWPHTVVGET